MRSMLHLLLIASNYAPSLAAAAASCSFCSGDRSYDLSTVPIGTFKALSGTPGSKSDPQITYFVTSPCASAHDENDGCISGPTSDPLAMRGIPPTGGGTDPICTGLGSLNGTKPTVTPAPDGLNITLSGGSVCGNTGRTVFRMICDPKVPVHNGPEKTIINSRCEFIVTWKHPSVCTSAPISPHECKAPGPPAPPPAICEGCVPSWKPTWNMSRSTALYTCNGTGMHDVDEAVRYGITVYDWSNAKKLWVNSNPMNDQELLTRQAEMVLAADPGVPGEQPRVWVYRNKILALNWYSSVRHKLDDEQYAGWFVQFKDYKGRSSNNSYHVPACDWYGTPDSPPKCSNFYHSQVQSPTRIGAGDAYWRPAQDSRNCCRQQCNCGGVNPCGEYTFDHRNDSFADWWINEYMISKDTLLHTPHMINLGWLDDGMSLDGPSEQAKYAGTWVKDTGSSPQDMQDHVDAFRVNVGKLQRKVIENGGFYWQMIQGHGPEIRTLEDQSSHGCHKPAARNVTTAQCKSRLRQWCTPQSAPAVEHAHLYFVCPSEMHDPDKAEQATAEFLLTRGPYAWIGYNWISCIEDAQHGQRPRPALWDTDFGGEPHGPCSEIGDETGIFIRKYPKATVHWDCNTGQGSIVQTALV